MAESQRLIAELGHIQSFFESKAGMTVGQGKMLLLNWANVARDAAAMLKEQEPVQFKVTRKDKSYPFWDSVCTGCGYTTCTVKNYWKYCPVCGKPVKWDDT